MRRKFLLLLIVLTFVTIESVGYVSAQISSSSVAYEIDLPVDTPEGTIICSYQNEYRPCSTSYDSGIVGVVTRNPSAAFINQAVTDEERVLIATGGQTLIRVSNSSGAISVGDLITSSITPGVAGLAVQNGSVLGRALESYDSTEEGTILADIYIHYTLAFTDDRNNLLEILRQGISAPVITPLAVLRYMFAGLVLIAAFVMSFMYFGRISRSSIEAIGRNPLGTRFIQLNLILNLILMFLFVGAGLGLSYLILIL